MEKKLKVNFILKGIAVFAFVAFCLLAILAGVTLPFVSNASTTDIATASADNTLNFDNFTIPFSQCNTTDTYYGFYFTQNFYNTLTNFNFDDYNDSVLLASSTFNDSGSFIAGCSAVYDDIDDSLKYKRFTIVYNPEFIDYVMTTVPYNNITPYVIFNQGFIFSSIFPNLPTALTDNLKVFTSLPFGGDTSDLENQISTLTAEKNALQTQVNNLTAEKNALQTELNNIKFQSVFGYIGDLKNNRMYFNTHGVPIIPEDIYCPYRNSNLVNYNKIGNDYYLSIVDAYDSNGNIVTDAFSGWKFTNKLNPDNTPSSFYDFEFFIRDLRVCHIDTVQFVDNCFTTPNYNNIYYTVDSYLYDNGVWAYSSANTQYLYSLRTYLTKDDVRDFFALFEYRNYVPVNDAFYLNGYNNASKGYFDDGYNQGYSIGKDEGYNTGFSAGDSQGFARGVESANTYSFLGLFGAIFDAPIKAIFGGTSTLPAGTTITDSNGNTITLQSTTTVNRAGLLNFNLMGVNLSGFVLALFSLSILVVVIKFALAKGR